MARHTLILLRHATASDAVDGHADFDRSLSQRGRTEAILTSDWLVQHHALPDQVISSAALRARQTTDAISKHLMAEAILPFFDPRLYHADLMILLEVLSEIPNATKRLLIVGHNPGLEHLLGYLVPSRLLSPNGPMMAPATMATLNFDSLLCDVSNQSASTCTLIHAN